MKVLFRKCLSRTDIMHWLAFPTGKLEAFQIPKGVASKSINVSDINGRVWKFTCSKRKKDPYKKPVLCRGWTQFVKEKCLRKDDKVIFYGGEGEKFKIRAIRRGIKLLGKTHWTGGCPRQGLMLSPENPWIDVENLITSCPTTTPSTDKLVLCLEFADDASSCDTSLS